MTDKSADNPRQSSSIRRVKLKRPPERLYHSISEVGEMLNIKPYVLRFWEKEFPTLRPKKNRAGNRIYQKKDIELLEQIRDLLYKDGYTILGARHKLREARVGGPSGRGKTTPPVASRVMLDQATAEQIRTELGEIRREVEELIELFA